MPIGDIITALVKIFIIIIPGYIMKKKGIIGEGTTESLSNMLTKFIYPCLILTAMQIEFSKEVLNNCKYILLVYACVIAVAIISSRIVCKAMALPKSQAGLLSFMLMFGNTAFMGVAILQSLFGKEAIFYGALWGAIGDIFMFSLGLYLVGTSSPLNEKATVKDNIKSILNPCFICVIIGLIMWCLQLKFPAVLAESLETVGNLTAPIAMIVVGAHLADMHLKELFISKKMYLVSFLKLIFGPLVALLLVKFTIGTDSLIACVLVMQAAMPCAMCGVIFAEQVKADVEFITKGVMLSTILSLFTVPLIIILLQHV